MAKKSNVKTGKKKNRMPQETGMQQVANYLTGTMSTIYVFVMLVIYPLYYHNKYYDMGDSKYQFFKVVSIIFLSLLSVSLLIWLAAYRKEKNYLEIFKKWSLPDYLVLAFLGISFLSFLCSSYKETALWGYTGWYMGLMSQLFFALTYFYISKFWTYGTFTVSAAVVAAGIVYVIGVLQRFNIDFLNMYEDLGPEYIEKFISTLGQTTWYTSYTMLLLPFGIYYFCYGEKLWVRIASGIFTVFGYAMVCTTNSDSAYVALVVILMVFFWYSLENNERFLRFWQMVLLGLASFRLVGLLQTWFPERTIEHVWEEEAITEFIVHSKVMLVLLIVVAILNVVFWFLYAPAASKEDAKGEKAARADVTRLKFLRYVMLAAAAVVLLGVVVLICLVTGHKLPEGSSLYNVTFFNFVDVWGNNRGFNWRMAMRAFSHASFKDVLIGVGPDCFVNAMDTYCAQEVAVYWNGLKLACAHNEFLNMLVTEGILGVLTYLGIYVTAFLRFARCARKEERMIPVMAAIVAYIGHNFFCYQQCITTATIFVLMGIGEALARQTAAKQ